MGWRPSLGMPGFAEQVVNGLICGVESGIRIGNASPEEKKRYADQSKAWNAANLPQDLLTAFARAAQAPAAPA